MTGWKTILVGALQLALYLFAWPELVNYLDPQMIATIAAVLMIALRFFTGTEIFKRR